MTKLLMALRAVALAAAVVGVGTLAVVNVARADSFDEFMNMCVEVNLPHPKAVEVCACTVEGFKEGGITEEELADYLKPVPADSDVKVDVIGRAAFASCARRIVPPGIEGVRDL